jgi:integrase
MFDYLQFLAVSGSRKQEALRVQWSDVDLESERVTIGADGLAKNWENRAVEFITSNLVSYERWLVEVGAATVAF